VGQHNAGLLCVPLLLQGRSVFLGIGHGTSICMGRYRLVAVCSHSCDAGLLHVSPGAHRSLHLALSQHGACETSEGLCRSPPRVRHIQQQARAVVAEQASTQC